MTFLVMGSCELTRCLVRGLLDSNETICALISMPKPMLPLNSANVAGFAKQNNIPYYEFEDINSMDAIKIFKDYGPDYIFCAWPRILKQETLAIPKRLCVGTHPTALPYNRGRHPLHWMIELGITETSLSFFNMDAGIDSGKVLLQNPFSINQDDTIVEAYQKMNNAAYEGTKMLCKKLRENIEYDGMEQAHEKANYWRKRTPYDVTLDLRMPARSILKTVRSYAAPYPCANLIFEEHIVKVLSSSLAKSNLSREEIQRMEPGKILSVNKMRIKVKTGDDIVELECADPIPSRLRQARYIYPPLKYFVAWPEKLSEKISVI